MSAMLAQEWHSLGVGMGYRYDTSPLVVPDGTAPTPDDPSQYVPTARPGHRAPHADLGDGRSTIDLFGDGFTLLRFDNANDNGNDETSGARELVDAAAVARLPLTVVTITDPRIAEMYERRLVLVRPDGMVAWRADCIDAVQARRLVDVVRGVPSRPSE
jgi:hypothetical protein